MESVKKSPTNDKFYHSMTGFSSKAKKKDDMTLPLKMAHLASMNATMGPMTRGPSSVRSKGSKSKKRKTMKRKVEEEKEV